MSRASARLIVAFLLAVWLAPSVGALGVGLHLALHHGDHGHGPAADGPAADGSSGDGDQTPEAFGPPLTPPDVQSRHPHPHPHHKHSGHHEHPGHHAPKHHAHDHAEPLVVGTRSEAETSHGADHAAAFADLLQAATHGHRHDENVTPDHDHDVTFRGAKLTLRSHGPSIALPAPISCQSSLAERLKPAGPEGVPRCGPPVPLFTTHCSLLL